MDRFRGMRLALFESEFEENLYALRRDKLKAIAALGAEAGLSEAAATYPNSYRTTHTVPEIRAEYDPIGAGTFDVAKAGGAPIEVRVAGRLMAIRAQGKAGFAQLQQGGQRLQIYVRKDDVGERGFALYKLLDLGDHVGVSGYLFRTRTGELSVHGEELTFLAKAMLALPDKYHGLEDVELRYRQRYVDLIMNSGTLEKVELPGEQAAVEPGSGPVTETAPPEAQHRDAPRNVREVFVKRAAILRAIRRFFDERGYLEVETPMMHTVAGGAAARPFTTHHNALDLDLSLRIAPELYLKRLVVGGMDRVYEINRNFRNEGVSTQHNPEFTMLEFYQAYSNYEDLMGLTEELVRFVAMEVNGTTVARFNGVEIDLGKWERLTMREAIVKRWPESWCSTPSFEAFDDNAVWIELLERSKSLLETSIWYWRTSPAHKDLDFDSAYIAMSYPDIAKRYADVKFLTRQIERIRTGKSLGSSIADCFEWNAEPYLIQPTIIYDFPLPVSPLSKQKPGEPEWVERFEFYIGGFEVGNAFSELNDPDEQRKRFEQQLLDRDRGDDEAHAMDEDYVRALGYGLPPTAGEGIGIDRLTMILTGSRSIRDVILFPLMRPAKKAAEPDGAEKAT